MFTKFNMTALAAVAALGFSVAAHAATSPVSDDAVSVKVSVAGVDLNTRAGAKVVLQRIHAAAREICGDEPDGRQLADTVRYRDCMTSTINKAVLSLGAPTVTAFYQRQDMTRLALDNY
jgi:UrcA family protein